MIPFSHRSNTWPRCPRRWMVSTSMLTKTEEPTENGPSSSNIQGKEAAAINLINGRDEIVSVAFLVDGKHIVSSSREGKIRRWRVEDGKVGVPMDAGSTVGSIAVSRDGKWVVSETRSGMGRATKT